MNTSIKEELRAQFAENQSGFHEWIARDNALKNIEEVEILPETTRANLEDYS